MGVLLQEGMVAPIWNKEKKREGIAMVTYASKTERKKEKEKGKNNNYANLRQNNYGRIHYL